MAILISIKPLNNDDRLFLWAIRVFEHICQKRPWEFQEYLPDKWRIRLSSIHDLNVGESKKELIVEARKWFKCLRLEEKIMAEIKRPECVKDSHITFLDTLQESGVTNMWGATSYLIAHTDITDEKTAETVLFYWMNSWKELHPKKEK